MKNLEEEITRLPNFHTIRQEFVRILQKTEKSGLADSTKASYTPDRNTLNELANISELVSYGLGSPAVNANARAQLSFLLATHKEVLPNIKVSLYDPVFLDQDKDLFKFLNLSVLEENDECCKSVSSGTIFFMIHCSWSMYNNLLWANWNRNSLSNTIIIGNDFNTLSNIIPSAVLEKEYWYIHTVLKYGLYDSSKFLPLTEDNVEFIDTALISFNINQFPSENHDLWKLKPKPVYEEDLELIRNELTTLNLT